MNTKPATEFLGNQFPRNIKELENTIRAAGAVDSSRSLDRLAEAICLTDGFLEMTLPFIWQEALQAPDMLPKIPVLKTAGCVTLTQRQCLCILANAFFCTFKDRFSSNCMSGPDMPSINFDELYGSYHQGRAEVAKLRMLFIGAEQFSTPKGYATSLDYGGPYADSTPKREDGALGSYVVAIDALDLRGEDPSRQYSPELLLRELCKASAGFSLPEGPLEVATGNWGCGVFGGDAECRPSSLACLRNRHPRRPRTLEFPCGFGPIRINPTGEAEVVWAHRIDPARAELASIPFPETGRRWRDVVLNDGAPNGYRQYRGQDVPVFDELELLESSTFGTYVARAAPTSDGSQDLEHEKICKLAQLAADLKGSAEDWSTSVRLMCKVCSEGRPHEAHDTAAASRAGGIHSIGIAATSRDHAESILSAWETDTEGVTIEYLDDALEPKPAS